MGTWTEADITKLKAAISSGVLSVRYDGPPSRTITYQSLSEMRSLLAEMLNDVAETEGTRQSYRFASHRKGF